MKLSVIMIVKLFFKKNGFGAALIEGLKNSKTLYSCIFNADGSFDPKDLPKMYNLLSDNNNNLDYVFTSRYSGNGGSDDDTLITKIGNYFFTKLMQYII